jgi:acyl carrier protein
MNDTTTTKPGPSMEQIERWVVELVSSLVGVPAEDIDVNARFDRYGIDSAASISVTEELEQHLGRELEPTLLYDYPTIHGLALHLAGGAE